MGKMRSVWVSTLVVFCMCCSLVHASPESDRISQVLEESQNLLLRLGNEMEALFSKPCDLIERCACSQHECSSVTDESVYKCSLSYGKDTTVCPFCDGQVVNLNSSSIRTPATTYDADRKDLQLTEDLRKDICITSAMDPVLKAWNTQFQDTLFTHVKTIGGIERTYPSVLARREGSLSSCVIDVVGRTHTIEQRWYSKAALGKHNLVYVLDRSALMDGLKTGTSSVLDYAKKLITDHLLELSSIMHVAVVTTGNPAQILGEFDSMVPATEDNIKSLTAMVEGLRPEGPNDLMAGIRKARDVFLNAKKTENADDRCLTATAFVIITQGRDSCELEKCQDLTQDCPCAEEARDEMTAMLSDPQLSDIAMNFISVGEESDDKIPREMMCLVERSTWHRVDGSVSTGEAHIPVFDLISAFRHGPEASTDVDALVATETFTKPENDGFWYLTAALPVFRSADQQLLGGVARDVKVEKLDGDLDINEVNRVLAEISANTKCYPDAPSFLCKYQVIRGEAASCPEPLPKSRLDFCFQDSKSFKLVQEKRSFEDARQYCKDTFPDGKLIQVVDARLNSRVASVASADGSWIGLRGSANGGFEWQDVDGDSQPTFEAFYLPSLKSQGGNAAMCVTADTRGELFNWNVARCDSKRPFICEMSSVGDACENSSRFGLDDLHSPLELCVRTGRFAQRPCVEAPPPDNDVVCDLGDPNLKSCEFKCCEGCLCAVQLTRGDIFAIIAGILLGLVSVGVIGVAIYLSIFKRSKLRGSDGRPHQQ